MSTTLPPRIELNGIARPGALSAVLALAVSGDRLAVGAALKVKGRVAGAVLVLVREGGSWRQEACLRSRVDRQWAFFGQILAISGDTVVAGDAGTGPLEVFTRKRGRWAREAVLETFGERIKLDGMGLELRSSLAIDGDTIVYGAPQVRYSPEAGDPAAENPSSFSGGAVLVYARERGTWRKQAFLRSGKRWMGDYYGGAVAISGDTLLVGAWWDSCSKGWRYTQGQQSRWEGSGAAYFYTRKDGVWALEHNLKPSRVKGGFNFGFSVALEGDQAVIGAPREGSLRTKRSSGTPGNGLTDGPPSPKGAAYVFSREGSFWKEQARLVPAEASAVHYGWTVALRGDRLVVSAPLTSYDRWAEAAPGQEPEKVFANANGALHVLERAGARWRQRCVLRPDMAKDHGAFGASLALGEGMVVAGYRMPGAALVYPLGPAAKGRRANK